MKKEEFDIIVKYVKLYLNDTEEISDELFDETKAVMEDFLLYLKEQD